MKLTEQEKLVILKMRAKEETKKPWREAYLKHDLFQCDYIDTEIDEGFFLENPFQFSELTGEQVKEIVEKFKFSFALCLDKGTRFVSYLDNGEETWWDDVGFGIERRNSDWAQDNLEGFKNLRS